MECQVGKMSILDTCFSSLSIKASKAVRDICVVYREGSITERTAQKMVFTIQGGKIQPHVPTNLFSSIMID